ncbi:28530_t:CDS:1, partial [Dentiscutata erythropus]
GIDLSAVSVTFKNVFYLDLGTSFEVESPSWVDLSSDSSTPFYSGWTTAAVGGSDNKTIYLFGGIQRDASNTDVYSGFTWQFDTTSNVWSQPSFSGTEPPRRRITDAVSGSDGKIYIFGGIYDSPVGATITERFADMIIVGTLDQDYTYGTTIGIPLGRSDHTATMLSDGTIVYIGGWDGGMLSYSS